MKALAPERIHVRKKIPAEKNKGRYVVYWMQQAQRVMGNHALEFAVDQANQLKRPVLVVFGLDPAYPEANWRHYTFMLEGLEDVRDRLQRRGIGMRLEWGPPHQVALDAARYAVLLVCDRGYLRHQRRWRRHVARSAPCPVVEIDTDVVVPVSAVSGKAEYAARTLRPKLHRLLPRFLSPLRAVPLKFKDPDLAPPIDFQKIALSLTVDRSVAPVSSFLSGGYSRARKRLTFFVRHHLADYDQGRNQLHRDAGTLLSPYLHFGHISALDIALTVSTADAPEPAKDKLLEELIVRRELAVNHVVYCQDYDRYESLPQWARTSLARHAADTRRPRYSAKVLEDAGTHDPYWNAAMSEMKATGYLHNYMRMYWGKKVLQWMETPQAAFKTLLYLNNKYLIDGRDPNSYAGVGWIFGLHDRPWKERPIFGKIRYMARSGLDRKFDMPGYVDKVRRRISLVQHNGVH